MVESQSIVRLLDDDEREETKEEVAPSLRQMTSEALANPRVREMLDAFRNNGPESLARFLGDPAYNASLDTVRGTARQLDIPVPAVDPEAAAALLNLPTATATLLSSSRPKVLLGVTGSVAAIKVPELAVALSKFADVRVIATERGHFFMERGRSSAYDTPNQRAFDTLVETGEVRILRDSDEWEAWGKLGDSVLHVDLRNWADLIVVAPLSANSLSKIANGACDDLLSCVLRAWDPRKPIVLAPAMNTAMWTHPLTASHIQLAKRLLHAILVDPVAKTLACGDTGIGAMAPISAILHNLRLALMNTAADTSS